MQVLDKKKKKKKLQSGVFCSDPALLYPKSLQKIFLPHVTPCVMQKIMPDCAMNMQITPWCHLLGVSNAGSCLKNTEIPLRNIQDMTFKSKLWGKKKTFHSSDLENPAANICTFTTNTSDELL